MKFLFIALMMSTSFVYADSTPNGIESDLEIIHLVDKGLLEESCKNMSELRHSNVDRLSIKDDEKYNRSPAVDKLFIKRIMKQSIQE